MSEKRLGELTEQELTDTMDLVFSEGFDHMSASKFFGTSNAMDQADVPEHVVVKGHVEGATLEGNCIRTNKKSIIEIRVETE
jgi:hypothetical protein